MMLQIFVGSLLARLCWLSLHISQAARQVFQRATVANRYVAYVAQDDHATSAQFRQSATHGLDSHREVVGDVIPRHRQEYGASRRSMSSI